MKHFVRTALVGVALFAGLTAVGQPGYQYQIDLTQTQNDRLQVSLQTPKLEESITTFYMPKIIPGTYRESDYGKFVSDLKAFDKKGRELPVSRLNDNAWQISKANKVTRLTYWVEDIFDTEIENNVYYMSGSNIDADKNFVIQTPAFFGYFEGKKEVPFEITITKPENFYGSTGLVPVSSQPTQDVYRTPEYDLLMDSPMMYNVPDTAIINVANAEVLISVYSPNNLITSDFLAERFSTLLEASAKYLGGRLPVDKYAFILYFEPPQTARMDRAGALEHSYSSFYYLPEYPQENLASTLTDIAAHEFFHIVTPLTIHSEEIENFNFNQPDLSRHLWLYEGVTEYASDHVQVRTGLRTPEEFVSKLLEKLINSQTQYNDTLPFTELSQQAAGEHADQYGNVYEKGALIAALLDIRLLELSQGKYDLQALLRDLAERYGKNQPFKDEELFRVIGELSYPQITDYLTTYVGGNQPLPYQEYFSKVGLTYTPGQAQQVASLGNIQLGYNQEQMRIMIAGTSGMNSFGQAMGYQEGDLIISLQGQDMQPAMAQKLLQDYSANTQAGDTVTMVVKRAAADGTYQEISLSAPAFMVNRPGQPQLSFNTNATAEQQNLRYAWLNASPVNPADVQDLDGIIAALYDVISGDKGQRNWGRFKSLFTPEATMGAVVSGPEGTKRYISLSPEKYQQQNAARFMESAFYEEELGRKVVEFNGLATITSAYQFRLQKGGEVAQRGLNSIQAVYHSGRWWITSVQWSAESPNAPLPEELLSK